MSMLCFSSGLRPRHLRTGCYFIAGAVFIVLLSSCATDRKATSITSGDSASIEPQISRFGTLAVAMIDESSPANTGFQKAKGKKGTVKEAVWDSAELGLSGPGAGVIVAGEILSADGGWSDPIGEATVAGAIGGVTAVGAMLVGPAVGAEGLIRSMRKVGAAELAEREASLRQGLDEMAQQQAFHDALMRIGAEKIRGGLVCDKHQNLSGETAADALLEARVDDLRLERAGSGEGSYFLHIKTHVRIVRVIDGTVCFEQHSEYRSDTALFLDWTMYGAIKGVAETGYQTLAEYYISRLLH